MPDPRYPVGKFDKPLTLSLTPAERAAAIDEIAAMPGRMRLAVEKVGPENLETPYREGGWTVRQVVHHVPDSHLNAYVRFKLAVTEDTPTIKSYDEAAWAQLPEAKSAPIEMSLALLEALHQRWVAFLKNLEPVQFARTLNHPERGAITLDWLVALYAWHGRHHTGHVESVKTV